MDELPDWPAGTVAILSTGAGAPHAIPISTAVRRGPRQVAFALAHGRESLARLREDSRCALSVVVEGVAVTALGRATMRVRAANACACWSSTSSEIQDHGRDTFVIEEGVRWRWTDAEAERHDAEIRALVAGA